MNVNQEDKLHYLMEEDKKARNFDKKKIINTNSSYSDAIKHQIIFTSDDRIIDSLESYARVSLSSNSKEGDIIESARKSVGITGGFEVVDLEPNIGEQSAKKAIELLSAKPVKGGKYNVIIDPFLTGTFIHEAFGHACEADACEAGESQLQGKLGEKVGNEQINVFDDPFKESFYGSIAYDSEAVESKKIPTAKRFS